jgi:hypothetical protein
MSRQKRGFEDPLESRPINKTKFDQPSNQHRPVVVRQSETPVYTARFGTDERDVGINHDNVSILRRIDHPTRSHLIRKGDDLLHRNL